MSSDGVPRVAAHSVMDPGPNGTTTDNLTVAAATTDDHTKTASSTASSPTRVAVQDARLANLPRELLDRVSSYLPTNGFNNLRLTCKVVENKVFPYWSNAFFKKKQFMITAFSLQTLVDISCHATLGPCITHLVIGLDCLKVIPGRFVGNADDYQQCKLAADLQESLLDTGIALQLLSTAFRRLPNLSNIDIRDFNSYTRYRDYNHSGHPNGKAAWQSYGHSELPPWSRYLDSQGFDYSGWVGLAGDGKDNSSFVDRVFKVILAALGQSANPVRGIETVFRSARVALTDGAFAISQLMSGTTTKLPIVLWGLTKLHLDIGLSPKGLLSAGRYPHPNIHPINMPKSVRETCDPATTSLRKFLSLTPNLTWLRLNGMGGTSASRLISWLALDPDCPFETNDKARWTDTNPKPVSLPLRRLDLGRLLLEAKTLVRIIKKFDKLEFLSFRTVSLGTAPSHDQQDDDDDDRKNHGGKWAGVFRNLPVFAPNLKHLLLNNLAEFRGESPNSRMSVIIFEPLSTDKQVKNPTSNLELSFADETSLETLEKRTWTDVAWLEANPVEHSSESGEGSLDNGDEDLGEIEHFNEVEDEDVDEEVLND